MKRFKHVIKDTLGMHARPAGLLAKITQQYEAKITLENKGKNTDAKKILAVLSMGISCGEEVAITIEGNDEEKAYIELQKFFTEQL